MEIQKRRNFLLTRNNPDIRLDYVSSVEGKLPVSLADVRASVLLRYIPDRLILEPSSFSRYLEAIETLSWGSLEEVAVTILNDISNQVVARWTQVSISETKAGAIIHTVLVEDRQPKWKNQDLLSRLKLH